MTASDRDDTRAEMRRRRAGLSRAERRQAAFAVSKRLVATHFFRAASTVGAYLAASNELDLDPLINHAWQQGKQVCVPVIDAARHAQMRFAELRPDTPLVRNLYGIPEPHPEHRTYLDARWLDLVLVPLVAFDSSGNRLGMGGGYYDRCFSFLRLRRHWKKPRLCGVAYACQEAERISTAAWDVPLACIVTDHAMVKAATRRNHI